MEKLRLGVVPIKRSFLSMEVARAQKEEILAEIRKIKPDHVEIIDVNDIAEQGIAYKYEDIAPIVRKMKDRRVDALFLPFCDFGEESVAAGIAMELKVPTLVWGPRDTAPNRFECRGRDTQCGIIAATKVLARCGVAYSYIVNSPTDSDTFRGGYTTFLRCCEIVKAMKHLRIAQIGNRPQPFMSVIANEGELLEKFGIELVPVSLQTVARYADALMAQKDAQYLQYLEEFTRRVDCSPMEECGEGEKIGRSVALALAIQRAMQEADCSVAAMECWSATEVLGALPCIAMGELADRGMPVACEGDINGAVTLAMLRACAMGEGSPFFADLTIRHPENDNAELLWHCGPFPYSLKDEQAQAQMREGSGKWPLKRGEITVCRFDSLRGQYAVFAGEGHATSGPETTGTYVWLETQNWEKWEEKLVFGPYIHHVGGAYGHYQAAIREAARYLGIHFDCPEDAGIPSLR